MQVEDFVSWRGLTTEEMIGSLFQKDSLIPEQYRRTLRGSQMMPEKLLMLAVLGDAWAIVSGQVEIKGKEKGLLEDALGWFFSEDGDWLYSLENVCETLGFNPSAVRSKVEKFVQSKPSSQKLSRRMVVSKRAGGP